MSWTSGYVADVNYTYGYYRELNPALLRLACLNAGIVPPPAGPLNYLELGYGQEFACVEAVDPTPAGQACATS